MTANASDSGNGGSSVVGAYQINVGLDVYVPGTGWGINGWGEGTFGSTSSLSSTNQLRLWSHDNYGEDLIINAKMREYLNGLKIMVLVQEQLNYQV